MLYAWVLLIVMDTGYGKALTNIPMVSEEHCIEQQEKLEHFNSLKRYTVCIPTGFSYK